MSNPLSTVILEIALDDKLVLNVVDDAVDVTDLFSVDVAPAVNVTTIPLIDKEFVLEIVGLATVPTS